MLYSSVCINVPGATVRTITGWIVTCWTLSSKRITTSPLRWRMPNTGGFSVASVPRPFQPATARLAPRFSDLVGLAFMPGDEVHFVAFDLARQGYRVFFIDPVAQVLSHAVQIILVQVQFLGNLGVGQVQAHEVQTQHPYRQRLVMACQHRAGQVVEAFAARLALIALAMLLRIRKAAPDRFAAIAMRATDAV